MNIANVLAAVLALWCVGATQAPVQAPPAASAPSPAVRPLTAAAGKTIRSRASAWWTARERRDHQRMYDLFEPAYRKRVPFSDFVKESAVRSRFDIADPRIDGIVPEAPDRVRVKVNIETHPPALPVGRVTAEDVWVRVAGAWYKVHQDVTMPFPTTR